MVDRSVWGALAFGLCNAGEALLAMWLIERWFGPVFSLDSLRRVLGFFAAAAVATATAAVAASGAMTLFGPSTAAFLDVWEVWFASDALGIITVAPLLIGVAAAVRDAPSWREVLEGTLAVVAVTASDRVSFGSTVRTLVGDRAGCLFIPAAAVARLSLPAGIRRRRRIHDCCRHRVDDNVRVRSLRRPHSGNRHPHHRCPDRHAGRSRWLRWLSLRSLPSGAGTKQPSSQAKHAFDRS